MKLKNGVTLNVVPTTKFKSTSITVSFIEPLNHKLFADLAIVSELMETSNQQYPKQSLLAKQLSRLYGAGFGTDVLKYGNLHILQLIISFPDEKYLPTNESTFKMAIDFLKEAIFNPLAKNGEFDAAAFELQKQNMINYVNSIPDDKQFYSMNQLRKLYFQDNPEYSQLVFGTAEQLKATTPKSAFDAYQQMLSDAQIQISVLGNVTEEAVQSEVARLAFNDRPAQTTSVRVHRPATADVVTKTEVQSLNQSKLNMAYYFPVSYDSPELFPAIIFNALFGGTPQSKLFKNVREKNSLAYYADSNFSTLLELLTVQTGISSKDHAKVVQIVNEQLTAMQNGDFSDEEIANVKADLINIRLSALDSQRQLLNEQVVNGILHRQRTVEEWCAKINAVSKQAIMDVAKQVQLQAIYFLDGRDDNDDE